MERIGKYEIGRKLGAGATATVYLGRDSFANRDVAIKLIKPEVLNDAKEGRIHRNLLLNEASLAGKLVHPHIVQIYDAVVDPQQSYIVMEYVEGGTLEPYCDADGLLPFERIVELVFKCTRALGYANRMGVTHRDIKPANIMLTSAGGEVKISDFGAAIQVADTTRTQVVGVGSPAYMSPQQAQEMTLTHQTDIWSLGVVMYQLLTGRLPFQAANNYAMVYQICNAEVPPPSTFRAGTPPALDTIVARALQKELGTRYAEWDEFSHDLAQAFRKRELTARQSGFADSEKFETLRALPFFREFTDVEIWEATRFSRWETVAPDSVIMTDGEAGDSFGFLCEGELRVAKGGRTLNLLAPGECFGEMAVISRDGHVRGADVIAAAASKVVTIPGAALRSASEGCRMHFYEAFLDVLAQRLRRANISLSSS
ncbi:MAG: protein kinase [Rhodocyclales bacterium]|nr:protein kinase [Rhodocyclales bacterium]